MSRPPRGPGMHTNADGYLRIHRGPHYMQYAHRAYADRQWRERYDAPLPANLEVHHLCRNRTCFPPSDYHLLILDARLHHAIEAGRRPIQHWKKNNGNSA